MTTPAARRALVYLSGLIDSHDGTDVDTLAEGSDVYALFKYPKSDKTFRLTVTEEVQ